MHGRGDAHIHVPAPGSTLDLPVVSKDGVPGKPAPIAMPGPVLMHDFAITEQYAVFMDLPLFLTPLVRDYSLRNIRLHIHIPFN